MMTKATTAVGTSDEATWRSAGCRARRGGAHLVRRGARQTDMEAGAARGIHHGHRAAVRSDHLADDGQADPRTAPVAAARVVEPSEPLEDRFSFAGRDADAVVADEQLDGS